MTNANTNTQANEAKVAAMVAIPPIELDATHGDLFGQIIFGTAKRALGGELGAELHKVYAERTLCDKTMYYVEGGYETAKECATDAYTTVKEIVVDGYESVKDWVTGNTQAKKDEKKAEESADAKAAANQAAANRARFAKHFDSVDRTVEYKKEWENGTGYFNHLITDKDLQTSLGIGELAKATDPHGRKMIIMQTSLGLLVIFARHNDDQTSFRVNADKDLVKEIEGFKEECTDAVVTSKGFDIIFGEADNFTLAQKLMAS